MPANFLRRGLTPLLGFLIALVFAACATAPQPAQQPVQSPNDDYQYRLLTLPNEMQVLLISDPDTVKAAASLDVAVGSGDNPPGRGGLAHFLEHMLFLGTDKYPDPAEYEEYITEHGGTRNAYTSFENTNYFFDVNAQYLPEALDRFAQIQEQILHASLLREALDVLGSRWDKLPERQRPHFSPEARFRILRIKTLLALSADETARTFRVSTGTIVRWQREALETLERQTVGSLLEPVPPVRRYHDTVRHLVQTLTLAGFPGDRSLAEHLARVRVADARAGRHAHVQVAPLAAVHLPALAVRAALGPVAAPVAEVDEGVQVLVGDQPDAAAVATVAAVRPAARDELLAPEARNPVAAITGLDLDSRFVDEFHVVI